jgi:hypothetical protein
MDLLKKEMENTGLAVQRFSQNTKHLHRGYERCWKNINPEIHKKNYVGTRPSKLDVTKSSLSLQVVSDRFWVEKEMIPQAK